MTLFVLQRQANHHVGVGLFCEVHHFVSHEVSLQVWPVFGHSNLHRSFRRVVRLYK